VTAQYPSSNLPTEALSQGDPWSLSLHVDINTAPKNIRYSSRPPKKKDPLEMASIFLENIST
jgi:hypothetical protein